VSCEHRRDDWLFYAAGELEPREAAALEAHLDQGCPECAGYLAEARTLVGSVSLATAPATPSDALKDRVMQQVYAEGQRTAPGPMTASENGRSNAQDDPPAPLASSTDWGAARTETPPAAASDAGRHAGGAWRRWGGLALAAAVGLVLGLAAAFPYTVRQNRQIQRLEKTVAKLHNEAQPNRPDDEAMKRMVAFSQDVVQTLRSSALQVVSLSGETDPQNTSPSSGQTMRGRLLWDQQRELCQIFLSNLQAEAAKRKYKLWLVTKDGQTVDAGSFALDDSGVGQVEVGMPDDIGTVAQANISYASDSSPGKPLLQGTLGQ